MKTRYFLLLPVVALSIAACVKKPGEAPAKEQVNISAIEQMTPFSVDAAPAGKVTVVVFGSDTLAVTSQAATFNVPKAALSGETVRAVGEVGQLKITLEDESLYGDYAQYKYWYYLVFEDTPNGDYDYNDVVLHGRIITSNKYGTKDYTHVLSLQPVAMGGTGLIGAVKVGILYKASLASAQIEEKILCEDLRKELYEGRGGFINTEPGKIDKVTDYLTTLFTWKNNDAEFPVVWFIEAAGHRMYAATTALGADQKNYAMISAEGFPYGISLAEKINYPKEYCPIWDAYPGFREWIKTGSEKTLRSGFVKSNLFIASPSRDLDLWDWAPTPAPEQ